MGPRRDRHGGPLDTSRTLHRPGADRLATFVLVAAAVGHALLLWNVCEDAFISFRYARNLVDGHGLVFNPGEPAPVEGYSNLLWVLLAALALGVGAAPEVALPALSVGLAAGLAVATYGVARRALGLDAESAFLGALGMVALGSFGAWATSGLETMAHALLLFLATAALTGARGVRGGLVAGLLGAGLLLVRTEGWAWALLVGLVGGAQRALAGRPVRGVLLAYLAPWVLLAVPLSLWRFDAYGTLVAATTQVKVHLGPAALLRGLRQSTNALLTLLTPALLVPAAAVALSPAWRTRAAACAALALAVPAYATLVGGDYMPFYRFHAAGLGFFGLLLGLLVHAVAGRWGRGRARALGLGAALVGFLPSLDVHLVPASVRVAVNFRGDTTQDDLLSERERLDLEEDAIRDRRRKARALRPFVRPGDTYAWGAIGAFGYHAPALGILDPFGLTNRAAMEEGEHRPGARAGHDTRVPRAFFYGEATILRFRTFDRGTPVERLRGWREEIAAIDPDGLYAPELHPVDDGLLVIARLAPDAAARAAAEAAWETALAGLGRAGRRPGGPRR